MLKPVDHDLHSLPPKARVQMLWEDRVVQLIQPGQLRVDVPIIGWVTAADFGYCVGQLLQRRWSSVAGMSGIAVHSVAGHCNPNRGRRTVTLLIGFDPATAAGRRLDNRQIARDLQQAIFETSRAPTPSPVIAGSR